jgi:spermidine synthase
MTEPESADAGGPLAAKRYLPWLVVLFVGSGCAALIYEIVWFQLLQLVIGSSAVSLGVLLGTFMGGMCLGSLALPRLISARYHPLRVYALLELGIGLIGLLLLFGIPALDRLYGAHAGHGLQAVLLRGLLSGLCLLPPTLLMGATLPAIARWVETTPQGVSWLGFFYVGNIVGAVCGCLAAGFYLLRVHDVATATYTAVAINVLVAMISLGISTLTPHEPHVGRAVSEPLSSEPPTGSRAVYVVIGLSGMCALGAEVVWTRLLSLILGGTVYTFALILAVFLTGLGIGSSMGSILSRTLRNPRAALGVCQLLVVAAIGWTAFMLARSLPFWPIDLSLGIAPWLCFQLDLARSFWALLPGAILWGASFPLALAAVARPGQDSGRLVGGVYAANTIGAILGALVTSLILIGATGTQATQQILIVLATVAGLIALVPQLRTDFRPSRAVVLCVAVLGAWWLNRSTPGVLAEVIAWGRTTVIQSSRTEVVYASEGMNASIAVTEYGNGVRNFHVSGKVVASSDRGDMRLQLMLGHMSALLHPNPRVVLVVGCGAGVTAGTFALHPGIERIVICEIEPSIPPAAAEFFGPVNNDVMKDPRVEVVADDGRHYILTTDEKFDIITSDPINPWVKGAASLYSKEYFELCLEKLNPGGIVTQWVPLYESTHAAVKSEIATFLNVLPHGTLWSDHIEGMGFNIVMFGQTEPTRINVDDLQQTLSRDDHRGVVASLDFIGMGSATQLLSTYAGRGADLEDWLSDAQVNRDRNLRLQYLAGLGLNSNEHGMIYEAINARRSYPEDLFLGAEATLQRLRANLTE